MTVNPACFKIWGYQPEELIGRQIVVVYNLKPRTLRGFESQGMVLAASDAAIAMELGCDAIVLLDVGGDVLAHGDEPGLASPLCDAVVLAAGLFLLVLHRAGWTPGAPTGPGTPLPEGNVMGAAPLMRRRRRGFRWPWSFRRTRPSPPSVSSSAA